MRTISRAKYTSTAASVPNWLTAVNEAPASSAKKTRDTIARWPDDDTGRNSVKPCTTAKTITCHQDMAETGVTTTTVPGADRRYRTCRGLDRLTPQRDRCAAFAVLP